MPDVREVPAQRRHQLRHLPQLVGGGDGIEQPERAPARVVERVDDLSLRRTGGHRVPRRRRREVVPVAQHVVGRAAATRHVAIAERGGRGDRVGIGAQARQRFEHGGEARVGAAARSAGSASPSRAAAIQQPRVDATARAAGVRGFGVVEQRRGHRDRDRPPPVGERVDHAELEPAAWAHGREQRGEVVARSLRAWASRARARWRSTPPNGRRTSSGVQLPSSPRIIITGASSV